MSTMTDNSTQPGAASFRSRTEDAAEIVEGIDNYDDTEKYEAATERLDEMPLSVTVERRVRIVLGTGGPHDELVVDIDSEGGVENVTYRYYHWFGEDLFEQRLDEDHPLYKVAERHADYAIESEALNNES